MTKHWCIMNIHGEACRVEQSIPSTVLASIVLVGIGSSELCDSDPQCCLSWSPPPEPCWPLSSPLLSKLSPPSFWSFELPALPFRVKPWTSSDLGSTPTRLKCSWQCFDNYSSSSPYKEKRHTHPQQYLKVQINLVWTWQEGEITTSLQHSTPCTRVPFIQLFLQLLGNSRVVVCLCKDVHCTLLVLAYEVLDCQRSSIIARTTCGSHYQPMVLKSSVTEVNQIQRCSSSKAPTYS